MAATVTLAELKSAYPSALPDSVLSGFIATVDAADVCLDANVADSDVQHTLKLLGAGHLVQLASGVGNVSSHRAATGAAATYKDGTTTPAWTALSAMDATGCVTGLLSAGGPRAFFEVVDGYVS